MKEPDPCLQFYFSKPRFAALLVEFLSPRDCLNLRLVCERFRALLDSLPDEAFPVRTVKLTDMTEFLLEEWSWPKPSEPFQIGRCLPCKARKNCPFPNPLYMTYNVHGEYSISRYPLDPETTYCPSGTQSRSRIPEGITVNLPRPAGHVKCPDCRIHIREQLALAKKERSSWGPGWTPFPPMYSPVWLDWN